MASKDQSNERKLELLNQLTAHRKDITYKKQVLVQQVAESKQQLKDQINIPKRVGTKIKSSFSNNTVKWFIGSAIGGLIISKFFFGSFGSNSKNSKSAVEPVSSGILFTIAGLVARPLVKNFVLGKAKDFAMKKFLGHQPQISQHDYNREADYYNGS